MPYTIEPYQICGRYRGINFERIFSTYIEAKKYFDKLTNSKCGRSLALAPVSFIKNFTYEQLALAC